MPKILFFDPAKIVHALGRLRSDERGGIAVMMGFLFPVLLAGFGLGFEISSWYMKTRSMQNAADAAVIAAAANGEGNYNVEAAAVAAQYGYVNDINNVTVTASNAATCPADQSITPPCYSVTISSVVPLFLTQFVGYRGELALNGKPEKLLTSAAVAVQKTKPQPLCLLTLSQSGQGLRTNGAPNSDFTGCSVMSDSSSNCNGSNLNANYGLAAGTNSGCGNKEKSDIPIVADPYLAMASHIPANTCGSYPQEPQKKNDPPLPASNQWSGSKSFSGAVQMCGDVQLTADVVTGTP
jgi:hypothetical protein